MCYKETTEGEQNEQSRKQDQRVAAATHSLLLSPLGAHPGGCLHIAFIVILETHADVQITMSAPIGRFAEKKKEKKSASPASRRGQRRSRTSTAAAAVLSSLAALVCLIGSSDINDNDALHNRSLRALRNSLAVSPTYARSKNVVNPKVDRNAQVWVINQPKTGTGTLLKSLISSMSCSDENSGGIPKGSGWTFDCPNRNVLLGTHDLETANEKRRSMLQEAKALSAGGNSGTGNEGKCMVVTNVRDPHDSIPSLWFWMNRDRYCDGLQSKDEVLTEYLEWVNMDRGQIDAKFHGKAPYPHDSLKKFAGVLEMFGVSPSSGDFLQTLTSLASDGHVVIESPYDDLDESLWAGCSLLGKDVLT